MMYVCLLVSSAVLAPFLPTHAAHGRNDESEYARSTLDVRDGRNGCVRRREDDLIDSHEVHSQATQFKCVVGKEERRVLAMTMRCLLARERRVASKSEHVVSLENNFRYHIVH